MPALAVSMPPKRRIVAVDMTRGIALVGMIMANTFAVQNGNGTPTIAAWTVTGRAATLFVMVAGISLALITGGNHPLRGRALRAAAAGLAVRAFVIAVPIGLTLGYLDESLGLILPYYGLLFLLAIPLLGLRPRTLLWIAGVLFVVGPLSLLGTYSVGLQPLYDNNIPYTAFIHPVGSFLQLMFTGDYPAAVFMIYICVGLAIGRLDLSSTRLAVWLLVGGLAMAVIAWFTSTWILLDLGGVHHLAAAGAVDPGTPRSQITNDVLWGPNQVSSLWWLTLRAHHTGTPFDVLHTLGSAMAVLGGVLLVTKLRAARRLLWPLGIAGSMTLTLYCLHALVLNWNLVVPDNDFLWWGEQVVGALIVAIVCHRLIGTGPFERIVAIASGRARRAVMARPARADSETRRGREPSELLVEMLESRRKDEHGGDGHDLDPRSAAQRGRRAARLSLDPPMGWFGFRPGVSRR
jgi:uncharacterized membrane protein